MYWAQPMAPSSFFPEVTRLRSFFIALISAFFLVVSLASAQQHEPSGTQNDQQPKQQEKDPKQSESPKLQKPGGQPDFSIRVNVPLVTLDVSVLTADGLFVPDLTKENFHVLEDGVPQTITAFGETQAPITAVFLVELTADMTLLQINALRAGYRFIHTLKPDDWMALVEFDRYPHIAQDFTQDKGAMQSALASVHIPLSREIDLFDALDDTLDRLRTVEGRKYIILMATGQDTFSRKILDQVLKKIESAKDTIIYSVDTGVGLHHIQADNQMRAFAKMTGGRFYFPGSLSEYGDVFNDIGQTIRNRYSLSYHSTNKAQDGSWRKIKVEFVDTNGHRPKYQIIVREGYRAKQEVQ
jgi:VWFA-related protein